MKEILEILAIFDDILIDTNENQLQILALSLGWFLTPLILQCFVTPPLYLVAFDLE